MAGSDDGRGGGRGWREEIVNEEKRKGDRWGENEEKEKREDEMKERERRKNKKKRRENEI